MKFIIDVCHRQESLFDSYDKKSADTKFDINGQINIRKIKSG